MISHIFCTIRIQMSVCNFVTDRSGVDIAVPYYVLSILLNNSFTECPVATTENTISHFMIIVGKILHMGHLSARINQIWTDIIQLKRVSSEIWFYELSNFLASILNDKINIKSPIIQTCYHWPQYRMRLWGCNTCRWKMAHRKTESCVPNKKTQQTMWGQSCSQCIISLNICVHIFFACVNPSNEIWVSSFHT